MHRAQIYREQGADFWLLTVVVAILCIGFVMVASASLPMAETMGIQPFHYSISQAVYIFLGICILITVSYVPTKFYQGIGNTLLIISVILLIVLLIPGVSRPINGSVRWFLLGPISFQPSELAKISLIMYLASYMVRRDYKLKNTFAGFLLPLAIIGLICFLLLLEPDFGTAVVILAVGFGMLFLGGVQLTKFLVLLPFIIGGVTALSMSSSYRLQRLLSFRNPWADQFDTGYQLVQSLIAFGRGGLFGNGLGSSVQKLHYLPEAHTDFIFAIIAEEFGLFGAVIVLLLFALFTFRALSIGRKSCLVGSFYSGYLAYGIGLWIGLQAIINIGVNIGILPTKGITLPLMSKGGSSILITCMAVGLLFRIDYENKCIFNRKNKRVR